MIYKGSAPASFSSRGVVEKTLVKNLSNQTVQSLYITDEPDIVPELKPPINEWVRPAGWPDLDSIVIPSNFEGVYLTYDNTLDEQDSWACFHCAMSGGSTYKIDIGHIESGEWIKDTSATDGTKDSYSRFNYHNLNLNYDYLVFKIYPSSSSYHFTRFGFGYSTTSSTGCVVNSNGFLQHCVERRGRLPYINTTTNATNYTYCTSYMECDNTIIGESNTGNMALNAAFYYGYRLKKINLGWPVHQWNVTNLSSMFSGCMVLEDLSELESWAPYTSNWHVTSIASMFYNCFNLKKCGIFNWDVSGWGNTTTRAIDFSGLFGYCTNIEKIDLSKWNTSLLNVTAIYNMFVGCNNVKEILIDNWITTNWTITRLDGVFSGCYQLVKLNLSGWDLSNCVITRTDNMFSGCYRVRDLSFIEGWDVSNWRVTQINGMFSNCRKISSLNLNNWDVSKWTVTRIDYLFNYCNNLKTLEVGEWDTSNWAVTNMGYLLACCYYLQEFTGFEWDTSNWPVNSAFTQIFYCCTSLKEVDLTKWDTTKFSIGNILFSYFCASCYSLEKLDMSNLDFTNVTTASNTGGNGGSAFTYACYNLKEFKLPQNYKGYLYLGHSILLSREEIVSILTSLKSTSTAIAITLGTTRQKLTSTDIAIATSKGYTVS